MGRIVYIDGENFVHTIVSLLVRKKIIRGRKELKGFDFKYLIDFVTQQRPRKTESIRYYGARLQIVKDDKKLQKFSEEIVHWNATWVNVLQNQGIDFIKCGHLKARDSHKCSHCGKTDRIMIEKGVDVGLAVDIVSDALRGKVDEIILFSADSDLLPAIKRAHSAGVKVVYAAFSRAVNRALTTMVDEVWVYSEDQIIQAYERGKKNG